MATLEWEAPTKTTCPEEVGWDLDPRIPSSTPEPPATMTLVPTSTPFLNLPREVRDMIYRHLLSTKYAKRVYREPEKNSLKVVYEYRFHPSILRSSRQIEREASHVLYTENLLVRISSYGRSLAMDTFGRNRAYDTVPILASGDYAKGFARHAMEISMFRECASPYDRRSCLGHAEHCFIMASDDLPVFGLILLLKNVNLDAQALSGLTLTVEIRHDMDVSVIQGEAVTENRNNVEDEAYNKSEAKFQEKATTGGIIPKNRLQSNTKPTDHQIRRLLEPLRRLHSLEAVYIEGPVTEKYKAPLIASMCGPEPSDQDLFDAVLAMFEDAEITDETGDLSSAITKMKDTLDTMKDYKETQARSYKSSPLWNAREEMQFNLETNLGWASLEKKTHADVRDAEDIVKTLLWSYIAGSYAHMAHDVAMVYYLWAIIWEALDAFGDHDSTCRSSSLKLLITFIQEGLRHEPGNMMLEQQLRRREVELQNETEVEDLMEMSDRIHERGDFAPRRE